MKKITVSLADRSYPVFINKGLLANAGELINPLLDNKKVVIISDSSVYKLFGEKLSSSLIRAGLKPRTALIEVGEGSKSLDSASKIYEELARNKVERNCAIIALGGGVVGDLAGFVASTYMRGLPFFQIPTTLLAQVDSSVGGKVGINLGTWKNLVGSFYQPKAVLIDVDFIATLPKEEMSNGLAEMIKMAFISSEHLVAFLESKENNLQNLDPDSLMLLIEECCRFKANIVEHDEKEKGLRRILNYGHTFGHAIESASNLKWNHGQAVSAGMMFAAALSVKLGISSIDVFIRQMRMLSKAGLPTTLPELDDKQVFAAMRQDKKRTGGNISFVLLTSIGKTRIVEVEENVIEETMNDFAKIYEEASGV